MRALLAAAVATALLGCGTTAPTTPVEYVPPKPDTTIPRELGPFGLDGIPPEPDLAAHLWYQPMGRVEAMCRKWNPDPKGVITFGRLWEVLAEPAKSRNDLAIKAAFVRFAVPAHAIGSLEFEGGTAELLISIFRSDQHQVVRTAGLAALTGLHLKEFNGRDVTIFSCDPKGDCHAGVLPPESPRYSKLLAELLAPPMSDRSEGDLADLLWSLSKEGSDLSCLDRSLVELLAACLADPSSMSNGVYWRVTTSLSFARGERTDQIFVAALRKIRSAGPRRVATLLEAALQYRDRIPAELRAAIDSLAVELEAERKNRDFTQVMLWLDRGLRMKVDP